MNATNEYGRQLYQELLAIRARRGDTQAFEELVGLWEKPLFYFVRRLLPREEEAWDVLQDVWVRMFRSIRSLQDPHRFRVWIYTIARRAAMSRQRSTYRERAWIDDGPAPENALAAEEAPDAADAERVHRALDEIPERFREVLVLRFLEDLSVEEIAEIIKTPAGTVKSRLYYAKQALKKILQRKDEL